MAGAFDIVMEHRKELVGQIISLMEQGGFFNNQAEWNRDALRVHNPLSHAVYKGGNRFRLMLTAAIKEYDDPRWATLKQYREKGYFPKKGEKGVACEKWIFEKEKTVIDADGNKVKVTEELEHPQVSYFKVFNASQIEGFPEYQAPDSAYQEGGITDIVDKFMDASECPISEKMQERAYYSPGEDRIVLPPRKYFKDEASFAKTVFHEMGHSTGHPTRLNRDFSGRFGSPEYAREELRAEISALFTETDLGIPLSGEHYEDHSDYLKSWIAALKKDFNEFFRACADAEKISDRLTANYYRKYGIEKDVPMQEIPKAPEQAKPAPKQKLSL